MRRLNMDETRQNGAGQGRVFRVGAGQPDPDEASHLSRRDRHREVTGNASDLVLGKASLAWDAFEFEQMLEDGAGADAVQFVEEIKAIGRDGLDQLSQFLMAITSSAKAEVADEARPLPGG